MAEVDEHSLCALPIEILFNDTFLGIGTGFVWASDTKHFLITNWHNLSGINPATGKHLSDKAAEPNQFRIHYNVKGKIGARTPKAVAVRSPQNEPLWLVHPDKGKSVDIGAIQINIDNDVDPWATNERASEPIRTQIGMDVFVLGYPFGISADGFPVWKRGSIASEPMVAIEQKTSFFVDTASRPGMSGSPVIRRSWGTHVMEDGSTTMGSGSKTRLVGVYSGRLSSGDPLDAQLGIVWPAHFIDEIVRGGKVDSQV
jgi:hypothetical protein